MTSERLTERDEDIILEMGIALRSESSHFSITLDNMYEIFKKYSSRDYFDLQNEGAALEGVKDFINEQIRIWQRNRGLLPESHENL